jgi:hypothetical protein
MSACEDCDRPYVQISTNGDDSGLLCPCCMIARLHAKGLRPRAAFAGGVDSVTLDTMTLIRRVENIELALGGRMNKMGCDLAERIKQATGED